MFSIACFYPSHSRTAKESHVYTPNCMVINTHPPQAVCFLRPTRENIAKLRRELRDPRFGEYHLCTCDTCCVWWCLVFTM